METLKTIGWIALAIFFMALLAKTQISFSPFKIEVKAWTTLLGWIMVICGIHFISFKPIVEVGEKYYKKGHSDCITAVKSELKNACEKKGIEYNENPDSLDTQFDVEIKEKD